jgi:serine/threonine protein kinase
MPPQTSAQTVGRYDLLEKIAEGGMGTVYKARHQETGQLAAIKIVPAHLTKNPVLLKRFEQEYIAAKTLDHANIVRALDFGQQGGCPYLVMEFVDGESLGQRLEREHHLPESEAIRIIAQVAQGLYRAHKKGLVHRDVKPDNVLLTTDGQVKLADLGLVKEIDADLNLTRTGRGLGTPHFMAPEQFRNAKNADSRCDIYSLAATLYQMVTGDLPFKSCGPLDAWMKKINNELTPPRHLMPSLSERVDWAIRRAMNPDPTQRPASCREFVEDLTGHSTRKITPVLDGSDAQGDFWYLVYKDEDGVVHTVKGTTVGIRRSLKEHLLGDASNVRASRSKEGPFELLRTHPEFRDLVMETLPPGPKPSKTLPEVPTPLPPNNKMSELVLKKASTPPPLPKPQSSSAPSAPLIPSPETPLITMENPSSTAECLKWLILTLVAVASALVSYYLMPRF